jgi:hypothetical protein
MVQWFNGGSSGRSDVRKNVPGWRDEGVPTSHDNHVRKNVLEGSARAERSHVRENVLGMGAYGGQVTTFARTCLGRELGRSNRIARSVATFVRTCWDGSLRRASNHVRKNVSGGGS